MRTFLAAAFFALLVGCTTNVGPYGPAVGGPCIDALDCAAGSFCLRSLNYPDGTCTTSCLSASDCRGASTCVEEEGGVCLLVCASDDDCARAGYFCRERLLRGVLGTADVCIGG